MKKWRANIHEVIFEADTPLGKAFDISLLVSIVLSIVVVMLESVGPVDEKYDVELKYLEWFFTIIFTIEYFLRIISIKHPTKYIFSFYGLIDLLSVLPTYLGLFVAGGSSFMTLRTLRLLRIFRIFKLGRFLGAGSTILTALKSSKEKIFVFLFGVVNLVIILGTIMYLIEGAENGFTSIPRSIYWAIVTLTTVGYGDIAPQTALGQVIASVIMITGYSIIAVPTGIVTAELSKGDSHNSGNITNISCISCGRESHDLDAIFCKYCGEPLRAEDQDQE